MPKLAISPGDILEENGLRFRFERRASDGQLLFEGESTGERLALGDNVLAARLGDGTARLHQRREGRPKAPVEDRSGVDFTQYPEDRKAGARRRRAYLKGLKDRGVTVLTRAVVEQAVTEIAADLHDGQPPHYATVCRWVNRADDRLDLRSLLDQHEKKGNRQRKVDPDVIEIIQRRIEENYKAEERMTVVALRDLVCADIDEINETRTERLRYPSAHTIYMELKRLNEWEVIKSRHGQRAADQQFRPVRTRKAPTAPLDIVEMDHTKTDLFVVDDETCLPIGRAWFTFAMDRCTRAPYGVYIGFDPPSVHSVMQCLRNGMLPKSYVAPMYPSIEKAWDVYGVPNTLSVDRGMEFLSQDLEDFCGAVGINIMYSPRKQPWYKAAVERYFKTLNKTLLQQQKGTSFSNIMERGDYDPVKNAVIPFSQLLEIVHRWLIDIYGWGKHRGLGGIPLKVWGEMTARYPVIPCGNVTDLDMLFGKVDTRQLTRKGIEWKGLIYFSEAVIGWIPDPDFRAIAPDRAVKFRYDPADLKEIRVLDPRTKRYVVMPISEHQADYATGLSVWQHDRVREYVRTRLDQEVDWKSLYRAKRDISEMVKAVWADRRKGIKTRQRAARWIGIGRTAPAGDAGGAGPAPELNAPEVRPLLLPPSAQEKGESKPAASPTVAESAKALRRKATEKKAVKAVAQEQSQRRAPDHMAVAARLRLLSHEEKSSSVAGQAAEDGDDLYAALGITGTRKGHRDDK